MGKPSNAKAATAGPRAKTAKLFTNGGSQAVRLPKEFAFEGTEVLVSRDGDRVVLAPKPAPRTLGEVLDEIWTRYSGPSTLVRPRQPRTPPAKAL